MGARSYFSFLLVITFGVFFYFSPILISSWKKSYGFEVHRELSDDIFEGHDHKNYKLSDFKGFYIFLYAGYTRCGTICGNSMQTLRRLSTLTPSNTKFIFLSIDPGFDKQDILLSYVSRLGEKFVGLRKKNDFSAGLITDLEIQFSANSLDTDRSHTDTIFLIDKAGKLRYIYPSSFRSQESILKDFYTLENDKWQK
jgi:cytochrome oxidase Cu insertion factor (SCO1/SenC/PrrC family)